MRQALKIGQNLHKNLDKSIRKKALISFCIDFWQQLPGVRPKFTDKKHNPPGHCPHFRSQLHVRGSWPSSLTTSWLHTLGFPMIHNLLEQLTILRTSLYLKWQLYERKKIQVTGKGRDTEGDVWDPNAKHLLFYPSGFRMQYPSATLICDYMQSIANWEAHLNFGVHTFLLGLIYIEMKNYTQFVYFSNLTISLHNVYVSKDYIQVSIIILFNKMRL